MNKSKNIAQAESMFDVFVGLKPTLLIVVALFMVSSIFIDAPKNSPCFNILSQLLSPAFVVIVSVTALAPIFFVGGWPSGSQFAKALVHALISLIFLFAGFHIVGPKHAFLFFLAWLFLMVPGFVWWTNLIFKHIVKGL